MKSIPSTHSLFTLRMHLWLALLCLFGGMGAMAIQVSIDDAEPVVEGDVEDVQMIFHVRLDEASASIVTVDYETIDDTALAGADYVAKSGTLTFQPGVTFNSVVVVIVGDGIGEGPEQFRVSLSNAVGATIFIGEAIGHIEDTDAARLSVADARALETSGQITTTVSIPLALQFAISTDWETYSPTGATATPGDDYVAASGTVTFQPGETEKVISVQLLPDAIAEGDEFFGVRLMNKSHTGVVYEKSTARMTIADVDVPLFSIDDTTIAESDTGSDSTGQLTVTLTPAMQSSVQVSYQSRNDTATAGADYTAVSGVLIFAPGETSKSITLTVHDDTAQDGGEIFYVDLMQSSAGTSILKQTGVVTITDNDTGALVLSLQQSTVEEGRTATGVVSRNGTDGELQVSLTSSDPTEASVPAGIRIRAGNSSETFAITGVMDGVRDEDVVVTISASASGFGDSNSVQITVLNVDNTRTVLYSLQVRGNEYGTGATARSGNGYLVIDQNTGTVTSLVKYSNGPGEVRTWTESGVLYASSIGTSDYWFMSLEEGNAPQPAVNLDAWRYDQVLGLLHRNIALGGRGVGDVAASLSGESRWGDASTQHFGMATLAARILLNETRGYNAVNTPYQTVLEQLATSLGISLGADAWPAVLAAPPTVASHGPLALYRFSMPGLHAGNNALSNFAYSGYLLVDYATHQVRLLPAWRQGSTDYYAVEDWLAGNTYMYTIGIGGGYQVLGALSQPEDGEHLIWNAYGLQVSHALGTGAMQRVPFAYSGIIRRHRIAGNGRGTYTQSSLTANILAETLTLNGQEMTLEDATSWVIANLLANRTEGSFPF